MYLYLLKGKLAPTIITNTTPLSFTCMVCKQMSRLKGMSRKCSICSLQPSLVKYTSQTSLSFYGWGYTWKVKNHLLWRVLVLSSLLQRAGIDKSMRLSKNCKWNLIGWHLNLGGCCISEILKFLLFSFGSLSSIYCPVSVIQSQGQ